jgi:hypothetical protein
MSWAFSGSYRTVLNKGSEGERGLRLHCTYMLCMKSEWYARADMIRTLIWFSGSQFKNWSLTKTWWHMHVPSENGQTAPEGTMIQQCLFHEKTPKSQHTQCPTLHLILIWKVWNWSSGRNILSVHQIDSITFSRELR